MSTEALLVCVAVLVASEGFFALSEVSLIAANGAAARFLGERRSAWAIAALAPVILIFAEILPKAVARRHADALATAVAYPIRGAMAILTPVVLIASGVSRV